MSVYGTGSYRINVSSFSWQSAPFHYPRIRRLGVLSPFSKSGVLDYPTSTYGLQPALPSAGGSFAPASLHHSCSRYGNINPLSISFACRLHLRPRLTLIRLALIRKPWSCGERVSHPLYRYLCLHLLFSPVHHRLPRWLRPCENAPLPLLHLKCRSPQLRWCT